MSPVITVENLSKKYIIGHQKRERYTTPREAIANGAKDFGVKTGTTFRIGDAE
jgi:hypothetical protein